MRDSLVIRKVAVLGAGVMGAQIAAHCVNAGFETLLFDLPAKEAPVSQLVDKAIAHLTKLKPTPLATAETASLLHARHYEAHLSELVECDLIIEAIAERMDWKESLYQRIAPFINPTTILVSNTSGLSINALANALPEKLRANFCGVHFFNPPRYMHLVELIPAKDTTPSLLDNLETWLTRYLGKGIVRAKDTPNFIANRIGVFSLLATMHHAKTFNLGLDEVDALTGVLVGRPKSATFRTMDVVGLDTMQHVVSTMQQQLKDDPWHAIFTLPSWLLDLIQQGHLGQKSGQGVYRKQGKTLEVYDVARNDYREVIGKVDEEVLAILKNPDACVRMQQLSACKHPQAQFLMACFIDLFHYAAFHLQDIANTVRDVDLAMRWGFGWQKGPFETWQAASLLDLKAQLQAAITDGRSLSTAPLPTWLAKIEHFYTPEGAFSPQAETFKARSQLPVYKRQLIKESVLGEPAVKTCVLFENEGVSLWTLEDDIGVVQFKSKANSIGQSVIDGLNEALNQAEQQCQGLILYQPDANNFSSGADLRAVASLLQNQKIDALDSMIAEFQRLVMRLKYSTIPTVAALRGRALGGGCELMLHCSRVVAAFEAYPGLVEVGVGLIPAGGGCKEMAKRAADKARQSDLFAFIRPYFEQIATAVVAGSAPDAQLKGYLSDNDKWVMHRDEVLYVAHSEIKAMQAANYRAPLATRFPVVGREGHARLQAGLVNWREGGFISEHDYVMANQLAWVLCGGDVDEGTLVDEAWILHLEKEAFMRLAATPLTQARIGYLLETGKPLRN